MIEIDYKILCDLDIHSVTFLASKMGAPEGRLMVSVEQGMTDKDKCRTMISHCFYAKDASDAITQTIARAAAINGIGKVLSV